MGRQLAYIAAINEAISQDWGLHLTGVAQVSAAPRATG